VPQAVLGTDRNRVAGHQDPDPHLDPSRVRDVREPGVERPGHRAQVRADREDGLVHGVPNPGRDAARARGVDAGRDDARPRGLPRRAVHASGAAWCSNTAARRGAPRRCRCPGSSAKRSVTSVGDRRQDGSRNSATASHARGSTSGQRCDDPAPPEDVNRWSPAFALPAAGMDPDRLATHEPSSVGRGARPRAKPRHPTGS